MTRLTKLIAAALLALAWGGAADAQSAYFTVTDTTKSVDEAMADLRTAVEEAGATIFAEVDHAAGAESVDMDLDPAKVLVFGNPQIGTRAMQDDILAGALLPLSVLVYENREGRTQLAYENPSDMFDGLNIPYDADYIQIMQGALERLTRAAASTE